MIRTASVTAVAVVMSLLAACGGGNDDTKTGVFVGPVVGLRYETPSRHGRTSATGEFAYRDGERVSFTVGGILLGSAPGADRLSAFDLFGTTPPTDAVTLRQLLTDRIITSFDRAANVTFFLQALDDDRDPANGIEVSAWDERLEGQGLAFGDEVWSFPYARFQRFAAVHGGIDRHLDPAAPLSHLYGQLGLAVPAFTRSGFTFDADNDGVIDGRGTYAADQRGRKTREMFDNDVDGVIDRDNSFTYDVRGTQTNRTFRSDLDSDGVLERVEMTEATFDVDGNEVARLVQDTTNGVIGFKQAFVFVYDIAGNVLTVRQSSDNGGNGSVESSARDTSMYDVVGRRIALRRETDSDGDGTPNRIDITTQAWNDADQVTSSVVASDTNADGTAESTTTVTSTYDSAGDLVAQDTEVMSGGSLVGSQRSVFTYDAAGHRLTSIVDDDLDGDGVLDYQQRSSDTYTSDGRRLVETIETDIGRDGTLDGRQVRTNSYNEALDVVAMVTATDSDGDGTEDSRITAMLTYDGFGNLVARRSTSDANLDGALESDSVETYAYTEIADGLYALLYQAIVD